MIESIKHRGLKRLYEKNDRSGIRPDLVDKVQKILSALEAADGPGDMALPLFRFHPLTGNRRGTYSVTRQGQLARYVQLSARSRLRRGFRGLSLEP